MNPIKIKTTPSLLLTLILLLSFFNPSFAQPTNDLKANAISINTSVGEYYGNTTDATATDEPSTCVTTVTAPGVWYTMSGVKGGVTIDLCASPFDSKINVYKDDMAGGLTCITGEDDDSDNCGSGNDPHVTFSSRFSDTYYIYVNGRDGDVGTFTLRIKSNQNQVSSQNDSGFGSLREVIDYANDGDTITFSSVTNKGNIILSSGPVWINKDLTIIGNGMENTIIDGILSDHRLFRINSDGNKTVHMEGMTIQNGGSETASLKGSGIENFEDLSLLNVAFKDNKAAGDATAALRIWSGNVTLMNCIFDNNINYTPSNEASTIYARGFSSLKVLQCLFINNSGDNLIYCENTTAVEIKNNTTYNNIANNNIIYVDREEVHMSNNVISESSSAIDVGAGITSTSFTHNLTGIANPLLSAGDNNIVGDPLFEDPASEDFNLALASPCFNAADANQIPLDIFDLDRDADTSEPVPTDLSNFRNRTVSSSPDMGCYERIPYGCENATPILISETVTEDITGHMVNLVCDATFESRLHTFTPSETDSVTISLSNYSDNKNIFLYTDELCDTNCDYLESSVATANTIEKIRYEAAINTTYYIEVYDYSKTGGTYDLSLDCDNCTTGFNFISPKDDVARGIAEHNTDGNITSNISIHGEGTEVVYSVSNTAGNSIELNSGFQVSLGAAFKANIDKGPTPNLFAPDVAVAPNKEDVGPARRPSIK